MNRITLEWHCEECKTRNISRLPEGYVLKEGIINMKSNCFNCKVENALMIHFSVTVLPF